MAGISIPIGGDMAPLVAAISEVKALMADLANSMRAAMAPAKQASADASRGMVNISTSASQAAGGMKGLASSLSNTGMMIANVAAGAKGIRSAFRFVSGLSGGWKQVAVAAAGAGVAVLGLVGVVKVVKAAFSSLLSVAGGVWRGIKSGASSAVASVKSVFSGIGSAIPGGGMLGPLAGIAGIAGGVALVTTQLKGAFEAASAFEDLEVRVSSFLGSTQAATDLLKELSTFADATPFSGTSIQESAAKLLGAGVRENIVGITKDLGAVAKDGQQLEELADALAKGFAKGKFQTEELNKFLERGINLMPALRQETGLTGDALTKAIEKGLGFETVTGALASMSRQGGEFFGMLERRSKTTTGLMSTLGDVWNSIRRGFAQPILDAIKPMLTDAIGLVESFRATAVRAGQAIGQAMLAALALIKSGRTMELMRAGFSFAITGAMDLLMRGLRGAIAFLATALPPIFDAALSKLRDPQFWQGISVFMRGAAAGFSAEIRSALPGQSQGLIDSLRNQSDLDQKLGGMLISRAGNGNAGEIVSQALTDGLKAFADAAGGPASEGFLKARDALRALLDTVKGEVAGLRAKGAIPPPSKGATGASSGQPLTGISGATKEAMVLTTSMARVGGGGFGMTFMPMVTEARRGNSLLTKIEANTRKLGGTTPAIA